jgi:hypothetical protein
MNINAQFTLPDNCECSQLTQQGITILSLTAKQISTGYFAGHKVLILTNNEVEITGNRKGRLTLESTDIIIGVENMSQVERQIKRKLKRNPC